MKNGILQVVVIATVAMATTLARAATIDVTTADTGGGDSYVNLAGVGGNDVGGDENLDSLDPEFLWARYVPSVGTEREYKIYLMFQLPAAVVSGTINSASLSMTHIQSFVPRTLKISGLTVESAWDETTITYNNAPANQGNYIPDPDPSKVTPIEDVTVGTSTLGVYTALTSHANLAAFLNNDGDGLVTIILTGLEAGSNVRFASRENTSGYNVPTLSIDYTPVPEPVALSVVSLSLLAGLRRRR